MCCKDWRTAWKRLQHSRMTYLIWTVCQWCQSQLYQLLKVHALVCHRHLLLTWRRRQAEQPWEQKQLHKKKERKKALTLKKAQLVAEKDQLKIQTALAVSNAKSEVYEDYDISEASCGMNSYSCQIKGVNTRRVNSCLCGSHSACGPKEDPWYGVSSIINNIEIMKMSSIMSWSNTQMSKKYLSNITNQHAGLNKMVPVWWWPIWI